MGYLSDDFDIVIPPLFMFKILKQLEFRPGLKLVNTKILPTNFKFTFNYMNQDFYLDYISENNTIIVDKNTCSTNIMVNPSQLVLNQEVEYTKIANFINSTIHELYMINNGSKVMGVAMRDNQFFLVKYTRIDYEVKPLTPSLFLIDNKKQKKQLLAMFKLTQATLLSVPDGWKWRSRNLARLSINGIKYKYLSFERLIAEIKDPNYMRHVAECKWYLDSLEFEELVSCVIINLNECLLDLISYRK